MMEEAIYFRRGLWLIAIGTIGHLLYSVHLELVGDEAYYWLWSRHLDICYLDKGPMTAWLIWLGTKMFGQTVFGVRFFAVILAGGTGLAILSLGRTLFSSRGGFWAVFLATVVPLFAVGASLMTIDTVYIFFWSWAAVIFWRAKDSSDITFWVLTGVLVGLGLLSKYTAAFEIVSFATFCLIHPPSRLHLRSVTFWSMVTTALLFLTPAIVWNVQHHWPTTDWLVQRGSLDRGFSIHIRFPLEFFAGQAGVISPLIFLGLLYVVCRSFLHQGPRGEIAYALCLFLPLFGFYFLLSFHYPGPPNWAAAAYVGGLILLAANWPFVSERRRWLHWFAFAAILLAAVETAILHETRWLHLPSRIDPLDRARGSRSLATSVENWQKKSGAQYIIADNYMTAALLSFYLPGQPETYVPATDRPLNQEELWANYDQKYPHATALVVSKHAGGLTSSFRKSFKHLDKVTSIDLIDRDRRLGKYQLYLGAR